jgi:hypothetical protein
MILSTITNIPDILTKSSKWPDIIYKKKNCFINFRSKFQNDRLKIKFELHKKPNYKCLPECPKWEDIKCNSFELSGLQIKTMCIDPKTKKYMIHLM